MTIICGLSWLAAVLFGYLFIFNGILSKFLHMVVFCLYGSINTGLGATLSPNYLTLIASQRALFLNNTTQRFKNFRLQCILKEGYDSPHSNTPPNHLSYWLGLTSGWDVLLLTKLEWRHWNRPQISLVSYFSCYQFSCLPLLLLPKTTVLSLFITNIH